MAASSSLTSLVSLLSLMSFVPFPLSLPQIPQALVDQLRLQEVDRLVAATRRPLADQPGLRRREGADAHRQRRNAGVHDPLHDAGVAVGCALEFFPQVGVGVELDDADLVVNLLRRPDRRLAQAVLAAESDQELP